MTDPMVGQDTDESVWVPKQPVVPSRWLLADFSDAFEPVSVNQRKVPAKAYKASGAIPVVDQGQAFIGGYTDDESLAVDPGEGVIVFGDHTRVFKRVSFKFAAGADGIKVLRPLLSDSAYAYYACKSLQFPSRGYSRHYSFLARCKMPIAPESEQKRIVSKIDELFSRIDEGERALERVSQLVERYRQSVLKAAVTGELTRAWREKNKDKLESGEALLARILTARREAWEKAELAKMKAKGITPADDKWKQRYEEPSSPDTTDLPKLPDSWTWASFGQLVWSSQNGISKRIGESGKEVNVLRLADIANGKIETGAPRRIRLTTEEVERYVLEIGDLLCVRVNGSRALTGRLVPVDTHDEWAYCDHFIRFRPVPLLVPTMFLDLCFDAGHSRRTVESKMVTTAGQNTVSQSSLFAVPIPLPSLNEQLELLSDVERRLSQASSHVEDISSVVSGAAALRQSVLKSAFGGQLVSQDLTDEPASTLLERIAAARDTDNAAPKRGRKKKSAA